MQSRPRRRCEGVGLRSRKGRWPQVAGLIVSLALMLGGILWVSAEEEPAGFDQRALQEVLKEYLEKGYAPSAAAVVIDGEERYRAVVGDPLPADTSLFQIGSITKSFTGLLLARAVVNGAVRLETTLGEVFEESLALDLEGAGCGDAHQRGDQ